MDDNTNKTTDQVAGVVPQTPPVVADATNTGATTVTPNPVVAPQQNTPLGEASVAPTVGAVTPDPVNTGAAEPLTGGPMNVPQGMEPAPAADPLAQPAPQPSAVPGMPEEDKQPV